MSMLANVWSLLIVDSMVTFNSLFVADALDGSEDYLVSEKFFHLFVTDMLSFRAELLMQQHPESLWGIEKVDSTKRNKKKGIRRNRVFH